LPQFAASLVVSPQPPDELLAVDEVVLVVLVVVLVVDEVVLVVDEVALVVDEVAVPPMPPPLVLEVPPVPPVSRRPLSPETSWQPPATTSAVNASVVAVPRTVFIVGSP
jgi:hypothetical protein